MKCKYCQAELAEGSTICPGCGKDNAEEVAEVTMEETPASEVSAEKEEKAVEAKESIKATPGKIALSVAVIVVLAAVLVALIVNGTSGLWNSAASETEPTETTTAATDGADTTITATVPADGNPDDVTCKGTYTVSDEEVVKAMDTVVATMGDKQLTNAQLQVLYWMQVQSYFSSEDAYYAYYMGFDYTQPFDTQICMYDETLTWQQFFLNNALDAWQSYQALANEAEAANFEMPQDYREYLDNLAQTLETDATAQGFESAKALLEYNVGAGAEIEDYVAYKELYYQGYSYYQDQYEKMMPTDEEVETYFNEHADGYAENGVTKDTKTVDVRHILIMPEGATPETIRTETFPQEAWDASKTAAEALLQQWLDGEATEDSFAALANEHSDDGDGVSGGLYTDVTPGYMVENFDAWCFDESRQVGDYDIVETEFGYHIMYFSGESYPWKDYARSDMLSERLNQLLEDVVAKHPMEVDYSAISLGYVDMTN